MECPQTPNFPYTGLVIDGYQYRRYQTGALPFWTPLGFPGQYFDAETDLFENWNRYYDVNSGRYLQSDPLAQRQPKMAKASVYAYAGSNPLTSTDPTGLFILQGECPNWSAALQLARKKAGCDGRESPKSTSQDSCECSKQFACDICQFLQDGVPPSAFITPLPGGRLFTNGASKISYPPFPPGSEPAAWVEFRASLCYGDTTGFWIFSQDNVQMLAEAMIHEAAHQCKTAGGYGPSVDDPTTGQLAHRCFK